MSGIRPTSDTHETRPPRRPTRRGSCSTTHFQQCSESGFADNYEPEAHVKLCLEKGQIDWLWNHGRNGKETEHGHCQTQEGVPHLGPEGLLVCASWKCWFGLCHCGDSNCQ